MNPRRDVPLVLLTQNMLPRCIDMYTEHRNKTFLTGLIRGNFEDKPSPRWCRNVDLRIRDRDGIWVPIKEILRVNAGQWGVGACTTREEDFSFEVPDRSTTHVPRPYPCHVTLLKSRQSKGIPRTFRTSLGWSLRSSMRRSLFLGCAQEQRGTRADGRRLP